MARGKSRRKFRGSDRGVRVRTSRRLPDHPAFERELPRASGQLSLRLPRGEGQVDILARPALRTTRVKPVVEDRQRPLLFESSVPMEALRAFVCAGRKIRREVMFAFGKGGRRGAERRPRRQKGVIKC